MQIAGRSAAISVQRTAGSDGLGGGPGALDTVFFHACKLLAKRRCASPPYIRPACAGIYPAFPDRSRRQGSCANDDFDAPRPWWKSSPRVTCFSIILFVATLPF
jgi:hypothetical protein